MNKVDGKVTRYYCDRCGKAFAESAPFERANAKDNLVSRGVTLIMPVVENKKVRFEHQDFCGNCVTKLSKWTKGK